MADTIAAVATAMTASGIGIIRISGPDSREIAGKIYRSKGGKKRIENVPSVSHLLQMRGLKQRRPFSMDLSVMRMK